MDPEKHHTKKRRNLRGRDCLMLLIGAAAVLSGLLAGNYVQSHKVALKPESDTITIKWLPATVKHWHKPIEEMAKKYNLDPNLVAIIITMESGGYSKAHRCPLPEGAAHQLRPHEA
jgi:soluble lytic murein transglycosylase-like protein